MVSENIKKNPKENQNITLGEYEIEITNGTFFFGENKIGVKKDLKNSLLSNQYEHSSSGLLKNEFEKRI